jgi:hypothetical protein
MALPATPRLALLTTQPVPIAFALRAKVVPALSENARVAAGTAHESRPAP